VLDEVQRAPELLLAVKQSVDRDRRAGQFILTGSANLLLARTVSESLAGRATYTTLWPLTRREQLGQAAAGRWDDLLAAPEREWADVLAASPAEPEDWRALARRGGFPTPAIDLSSAEDRRRWFEGYTRTYLERDLQELSSISALPDFRRVMRAAALRAGQMLNQAELSRDVGTPGPTVHRWLNLLEVSYQLVRLPAFSVNRTRRLIKSPKIYWSDVGMALYLSDDPEPGGAHLENLVLLDLLAWRDAREARAEVLYWRTTSGAEVDFVIESAGRLLPIEVKATRRPRVADARHLRTFREEYGDASLPGLLLHAGEDIEWLGPGILAAPWWTVM
jgi:predicted AAA+ superfamily ATPase